MYDSNKNQYDQYVVDREAPLLDWMLSVLPGSRTKIKAILQGRGIKVDGKQITQFDFPLKPGMKVSVSKSKKNDTFKSRYVNIVYEDRWVVVVDKQQGVLSMPVGAGSLNMKSLLDQHFAEQRSAGYIRIYFDEGSGSAGGCSTTSSVFFPKRLLLMRFTTAPSSSPR
jgi:23S rRNA pseudouridine1911/1915/1917 synthase